MTAELHRRGYCVNHERTERLAAENTIVARDGRRRRVRTTIPDVSAPSLPDLVRRDCSVGEPGLRACGDIASIPTAEGWLYLASVLDLGSRRLVGSQMGEAVPWELWWVRDRHGRHHTLRRGAGDDRPSGPGHPVPHLRTSGRTVGSPASSHPSAGSAPAMTTARRNPHWAILKRELISRAHFETRAEAQHAIGAWIRHDNTTRLHSSLGNLPPIEWELRCRLQALDAA